MRRLLSILYVSCVLTASHTALAQSPPLAQPVAPWMDTTGEVRNYRNFRTLQIDPALTQQDPQNTYISNESTNTTRNLQFFVNRNAADTAQSDTELTPTAPPSSVERSYAARITKPLPQFGYDLFGESSPDQDQPDAQIQNQNTAPSAAVQDSFVLGQGDELEVIFAGQRNDRGTYTINNNGILLIPDLPPIPASGRTIGQIRLAINDSARALHNTQSYVSLASVRQINALVIGNVNKPGRKTLSVFHTVLDAIMESGGIDKTGSLRQIKLIRDGRSTHIDLYALLMHGQSNVDLRLRDGDRIIVPPIGPTVAISGEVTRPGIYEILPRHGHMPYQINNAAQKLTLNDMLGFAGGITAPGQNRLLKLSLTTDGQERVETITDPLSPVFDNGSILVVAKASAKREGMIELQGHARGTGLYALSKHKTLQTLLSSDTILGADIYPLIGVIEREDTEQFTQKFIEFPLNLVLKKRYDRGLEDGDVIHLFSNTQISNLQNPALHDALTQPIAYGSTDPTAQDSINTLTITDPVLHAFLIERSSFIRGAVRNPGAYPVADGTTLDAALAVAGGLTLEANRRNIEITSKNLGTSAGTAKHRQTIDLIQSSAHDIIIEAGASIRVNQRFDKISDQSVLIMGEIENPGRYDLITGDTISDLLTRAGGLTSVAYPYGAIFSRKSERKTEEARYQSQARTIKQSIAAALQSEDKSINAGKIAEARALAAELEQARGIGRITIEADPAKLTTHPELDLLLQSGDRIYIPKRDLTVRVHGEVLSAASLQFREGKSPLDYINEAGGFTFHADKDRSFVLYPDGSAQPLQVSAWNYNPIFIPPGSTIVVPRDPKPFDFIQSAKDVSQILSNLAVTTIFIDDVISDD